MNVYEKIAKETRKKVSKLTLGQQNDLLELYEDTIEELASKAAASKDKSLTQRWLLDYIKELTKAKKELIKEIESNTKGAIGKAAKIGTETEQQIMSEIFKYAGIDTGEHFDTMFSQVQDKVIKDIILGNLYKDNKTLSSRIWNYGNEFEKDIQYVINRAILEKKSAIELAKDLEKYVKDPAKRDTTWGRCYPHLKNKKVDYNAMRLARTSINHAYQTSTIQSSSMNPFVEGIEWRSALIHGRTCELCQERHEQVFTKDDVPLDHPNGLCTMVPYIPKSLDTVADELKGWLDGEDNPKLDSWYNEYGDYFSGLNKEKCGIINTRKDKAEREQNFEKIKQQQWTKTIKDDDKDELFKYFERATDEELTFWEEYGELVQGEFYDPRNSGYYSPASKKVNLNITKIDNRSKRIGDTKDNRLFFHETGHLFDDRVLRSTGGKKVVNELTELKDKLEKDYLNYANKILKNNKLKGLKSLSRLSKEQKSILGQDLREDEHLKNAISDIVEGLTNGRVVGGYGHGKNYWKYPMALEQETIAHSFEAKMMKGERKEVFTKYFPNAFEYFNDYINKLVR